MSKDLKTPPPSTILHNCFPIDISLVSSVNIYPITNIFDTVRAHTLLLSILIYRYKCIICNKFSTGSWELGVAETEECVLVRIGLASESRSWQMIVMDLISRWHFHLIVLIQDLLLYWFYSLTSAYRPGYLTWLKLFFLLSFQLSLLF